MTTTYTIRKPYQLWKNTIINDFDQDGEIMITFFPTIQTPYIETDEYLNDPIVFEWEASDAIAYLETFINKDQLSYAV